MAAIHMDSSFHHIVYLLCGAAGSCVPRINMSIYDVGFCASHDITYFEWR